MNTLKEIQDVVEAVSFALDDWMFRFRLFGDGSGMVHNHDTMEAFGFSINGLYNQDLRDLACAWFFEGYPSAEDNF